MKIIIHSLAELLELAALIRGGSVVHSVGDIKCEVTVDPVAGKVTEVAEAIRAQCGPSSTAAQAAMLAATAVSESSLAAATAGDAEAGLPAKDADGAPHNTDWHSDPAKVNADGTWRARRKRDEQAYKDWLLTLAVEVAEAAIAEDDAEPAATETHALPQDEPESAGDPAEAQTDTEAVGEAAPTVDHTALIEASQEAAKGAPDGTIDLLNAGKEFIKEYGTAKFEALKGAVCPTEDGKGKSIPSMAPAERRLMRACMDNYALYL